MLTRFERRGRRASPVTAAPDPRLDASIWALHRTSPELSAVGTLTARQRLVLVGSAVALFVGLGAAPVATAQLLVACATGVYIATVAHRLRLVTVSMNHSPAINVSDDEALAVPDHLLPVYTVLVPAYREPGVVTGLLAAIDDLHYPRRQLDVKLLLEEGDDETIAAVEAAHPGSHVEVVVVPRAEPKTKPKALNYGLATARGELVTVYDAEDRPEPLQLRRAAVAMRRCPPEVACLQAELSYHNPNQNWITRWFTIEYAMWFTFFLPGLVHRGAPVPLGGTSNHFRIRALLDVGAWDPFNVTEDADLGIRLHRAGFRVGMLDSTTLEEANCDFVNWVKQRSRWYKGYWQTWLVHLRRPVRLWRELGPGGFLGFNLFVGGTPLLALLNPLFWTLTLLWFLVHPAFIEAVFPGWLYYPALFSWLAGNFAMVYTTMICTRASRRAELIAAAALFPIYWVMMAIAALKAAIQLLSAPSFWEKTTHGLTAEPSAVVDEAQAS